jgi:Na+-driven multidrug efflux pump
MKLDFKIIKDIIRIGSSPFFMMLATTFVAVFSNRALAKFGGDEGLSSLGAISSIFMIVETFLYGLMMGSQPVIGYNYGAKLKKRVYEALKYAYIYATSIAIVGLLFILLFSGPLVSIFSKGDKEFMIVAENGLKIFMSMIPFVAIHMMSVMYFQATGQALKSIILNLSRKTFFYLPALFIMPRFLDLNGIWIATPIADFLSCLVAISFIFYEFQKEYKSNEIKSDTLLI